MQAAHLKLLNPRAARPPPPKHTPLPPPTTHTDHRALPLHARLQYLYLDYNNVEHALAGCNLRCPDPAPLFRTGLLLPTQCFYAWPSSFSSRSFSSRSGGARASL